MNLKALAGNEKLYDDLNIYAQSKLAITMWSYALAALRKGSGPVVIAVNPGSLLATKMVKEGFGMAGHDVRTGSDILMRLALEDQFAKKSGCYFDNDIGEFISPHADAVDYRKCKEVVTVIEEVLNGYL